MAMEATCMVMFTVALTLSASRLVSSVHGGLAVSEAQALLAFKNRLNDPHHYLNSWDPSFTTPCGTWFHVICNPEGKVISVDLSRTGISGNLVPELGQLSALQHLRLDNNGLQGTIPFELGNLKNLVELNLSTNKLSGRIPLQIASLPSLRLADFSNNGQLCWEFKPTPVFNGNYGLCK